jgi:hypothetical protein
LEHLWTSHRGQSRQSGYYNNVHGDKGRGWGTFEGKVTVHGERITVEGNYKLAEGDGEFRSVSCSGKFKTVLKSATDTEIECKWDGKYALAKAQAR